MDRAVRINRLKWLAARRSTRELEILLGRIVAGLPWSRLPDEDIIEIDRVLNLDDRVLWRALLDRAPPPGVDLHLWRRLLRPLDRDNVDPNDSTT